MENKRINAGILLLTTCGILSYCTQIEKRYDYELITITQNGLEISVAIEPHSESQVRDYPNIVEYKNPYCVKFWVNSNDVLSDSVTLRIDKLKIASETIEMNELKHVKPKAYSNKNGYYIRNTVCNIDPIKYEAAVFHGSISYEDNHIPVEVKIETNYRLWLDPLYLFDKLSV
tara:strand:- start:300 stop:818 length:519 start_codon:yes stop_codon:yes gene_type:complete